jgi:hypothetical protein
MIVCSVTAIVATKENMCINGQQSHAPAAHARTPPIPDRSNIAPALHHTKPCRQQPSGLPLVCSLPFLCLQGKHSERLQVRSCLYHHFLPRFLSCSLIAMGKHFGLIPCLIIYQYIVG